MDLDVLLRDADKRSFSRLGQQQGFSCLGQQFLIGQQGFRPRSRESSTRSDTRAQGPALGGKQSSSRVTIMFNK